MTDRPIARAVGMGRFVPPAVGDRAAAKGITPGAKPERSGALSGGLDSDSAAAWSALSIARDQHAGEVPCVDRPEWTSDRPAERAAAAAECAGCPVIAQCASYAATAKERWNTWAGLDLQIPANRRRLALSIKEAAA